MRSFTYAGVLALAILAPAAAQDDGATRIERFLEQSLSGEGRVVTVRGFRGALTGRAELASLTVSDGDGDWLTLSDAVLDWDRAALLRGRLEVDEITAARIDLPRLPVGQASGVPAPEASGTALSLPDLPVAVNIGTLTAEVVTLGSAVLGQPAQVRIDGSVSLENGEGAARLSLDRIDGAVGRIEVEGSYSNVSTELDLALLFDEGPGGIAAGLLNLPGAPPLRLTLEGTGPVDDFGADLTLQTDGEERLTARFETTQSAAERVFDITAGGDLRPLVDPAFHPFFGAAATLQARATGAGGAFEVESLSVQTGALDLQGSGALDETGLPQRLAVTGTLGSPDDAPLVLPVPGGDTTIDGATLDLAFDAAVADQWTGNITLSGLQRPGLAAEDITLDGEGLIASAPNRVTLGADFAARALDFGSQDAATAFGEAVTGRIDLTWDQGGPLRVSTLRVTGESYRAEVSGQIANLTTSLDLEGRASVSSDQLAAFGGLAGRPLAGAIEVTLTGAGGVFTGLVDARAVALSRDLVLGEPRLDPYLAGEASIELAVRRTTGGTFLDTLRITGRDADIDAQGALARQSGNLTLSSNLADIAPIQDGLEGPARLSLVAEKEDAVWTYQSTARAMAARISAEGTLTGALSAASLTASGQLGTGDLSRFSTLAGRPLSGSGSGTYSARVDLTDGAVAIDLEADLKDAKIGIDEVDRFLSGAADLAASATRTGTRIDVPRLSIVSAAGRLSGQALVDGTMPLRATAAVEIADLAQLVPGLAGPATAQLSLDEPQNGAQAFVANVASDPLSLTAEGVLEDLAANPVATGSVSARASDLSVLSGLAGRPLGGALTVQADGTVAASLQTFDLAAELASTDLQTGVRDLDLMLAGALEASLDARRADGTITITAARAQTPRLTANANGQIGQDTAFAFDARLNDIAPFVPGLSGALTAEGRAETLGNGRAAVSATVNAPAGTRAQITGDVADDGSDVNLAMTGQAALGLANRILAPRALSGTAGFDLALQGPVALDGLSGEVTLNGARLIAPVAGLGLTDITGQVALAGARATVQVESAFEGGGQVRLSGPVALTDGQTADLALTLSDVVLTDARLYRTRLDAALGVTGPLAGGATVAGRVDVGATEVRIPSGGGLGSAGLPDITHIDEPAGVRATRARAGLIGTRSENQTRTAYGLDVAINAPNQIFVRGRGLDAELGGALRLRGTTANVIPDGRLDLIRGRLDILGQRLEMSSGGVELTGALDPQISLVAETEAEDVDVEIRVEGSASDPTVTLSSRPELPEDEVLALLLFGQGLENLSPLQIARLAAAVATLGSSGDGLLGGARSGVGLADLDVTSSDGGGAAVRAGAYIADNIYTDLTVDTDGNSEVQLNLDLSDALTVRGRTSTTGNSGLGIFFERDY